MKSGRLLGERYKIDRLLGKGGMGDVYLCEDTRLPGSRWALRELTLGEDDREGEIFEHEATQLARLSHPSIPHVIDFFGDGAKRYLVMEFVRGTKLGQVVEAEGAADQEEAVAWGRQLAGVVDYLHREAQPLLFRQLGPHNIMVTEERKLKLVDFGLARHLHRGNLPEGAPELYEAPEIRGLDQAGDQRADVYAVGATLFFLLTGFPPDGRAVASRRPQLARDLGAIVDKCLDPDPARRYQSAAELEAALAAVRFEEAPLPEQPARVPPAPRPPIRRETVPGWLNAVLLSATVMFVAGAALGLYRPASQPLDSPEFLAARTLYEQGAYARSWAAFEDILSRTPDSPLAAILAENSRLLSQGAEVVRIPVITSLQGVESEGVQLLYGLALCQRDENAAGRAVVLDVFDDQSRVERTLELAEAIAADARYPVLIGPFSSQHALAVAPLLNGARMPMIAPVVSDGKVDDAGPYIFSVSESDLPRVEILAHRFISAGFRRAAIFHDNERSVAAQDAVLFKEAFRRLGGTVVAEDSYNGAGGDFGAQVDDLLANDADCVFLSEYRGNVVGRFARRLRGTGADVPIATIAVANSQALVEAGGPAAEGILLSSHFHRELDYPEAARFLEDFQTLFGHLRVSHREANAYDSLALAMAALRDAGPDRQAVRDYLYSIGRTRPSFQGVSGEFAPGLRLERRKVFILEVRNGVYELNAYIR